MSEATYICWYDSPKVWDRRKCYELDLPTLSLWVREREHPSDVWPAAYLATDREVTVRDAARIAAAGGCTFTTCEVPEALSC